MVTGNDMHGDTKSFKLVYEHFTIPFQHLVVDKLAMLKVIAQMKDGLDAVLLTVRKEDITIELLHVIKEDVTSVLYTRVCVIQDCNFVTLHMKYSSSSWSGLT